MPSSAAAGQHSRGLAQRAARQRHTEIVPLAFRCARSQRHSHVLHAPLLTTAAAHSLAPLPFSSCPGWPKPNSCVLA